jgi:hypothetical protein
MGTKELVIFVVQSTNAGKTPDAAGLQRPIS